VGVPLSLLEIEPRHEYAVIEFGASHVGEIAALAKMAQPEAAVITTIAPAHLADFGSMEQISIAKGELVEAIPSLGFVALNGDDERVRELASRSACRVITFGEGSDCDVRGRNACVANDRITFDVDGAPFSLRAIGRHHLTAALASVAVGRELGLSDHEIAAGLSRFEAVGGRCHGRRIGPWTVIDDTYNANPASMLAACHALRDWQGARNRWLVLGDMLSLGPNSAAFHRELGRSAAEAGIDGVAALGAFADDVIAAAKAHGMSSGRLGTFRNAETLMATLDCWLETDDVVLVKGSRGMQMEQIVAALNQLAARRVSHQETRQAA
jgi:UDP-N-acetylmuramoyl-tripeptide--D-alanyl-D-alanine ligase